MIFSQPALRPATHKYRLQFILFIVALLSLTQGLAASAQTVCTPSIKTDLGIYNEPLLPVLPAAGATACDPTFGSTIMRVTDANDGSSCSTAYSYWPTLNSNSTRLLAICGNNASFYRLDPETFVLSGKTAPAGSPILDYYNGAYWDKTDPDVIYAMPSMSTQLYKYNVATNTTTLVKDFAPFVAPGRYLYQLSMSDDNSVVGLSIRRTSDYAFVGTFAYNLNTSTVLMNDESNSDVNEVYVSKSGRWILVARDVPQRTDYYDTANGNAKTTLLYSSNGMSHSTVQSDYHVGFTNYNTSTVSKWAYTNVAGSARQQLLALDYTHTGTGHISALNDGDGWALISLADSYPHVSGRFHNELFLVKTDGSGSVWRVAHHRAYYSVYEDSPRANISRDGRFVAFTSNWGVLGGRRDLFIAKIPPPDGSTLTPKPTAMTIVDPPPLRTSISQLNSIKIQRHDRPPFEPRVQVNAQDWRKITCPDGFNNRIDVEYKAGAIKDDQSHGRDDKVQYFFRVTNRYQTEQRVWVNITTQNGNERQSWNNAAVTLTPHKPFNNSSRIAAYGTHLLGCRVSFYRPGATGKSISGTGSKPLNPGVEEIVLPRSRLSPKPKQKSRESSPR